MFAYVKLGLATLLVTFTTTTLAVAQTDSDGDGVTDDIDVCCNTPTGVPVDVQGRPIGDFDLDCDVDLFDLRLFMECFTGILAPCEVDECTVGTHDCDPHATCTDLPDGYECACNAGYEGDGFNCDDIDECDTVAPCWPNGECINEDGFYSCDCDPGFEEREGTCLDIDECAGSNPCGAHGLCNNEEGSYYCACDAGYQDVGGTCVDIDECIPPHPCGVYSSCHNLPGSYSCSCWNDYADCDSSVGCEVYLGGSANTCATAQYIGEVCGDAAGGFGCPGNDWFTYGTYSGRGQKWFRTTVSECSSCCADLNQLLQLSGGSPANYDLYVYSSCGGSLVYHSSASAGFVDQVQIVVDDICPFGGDESQDFWILIKYSGGESCAQWTLTVKGLQ